MKSKKWTVAKLCAASAVASTALLSAQAIQLPSEPPRQFGTSITGSFDGWYVNPDKTNAFLVGYLNRNLKQAIDVPIGPNNRIEPGGPDLGQPTHFLPGRQTGVFAIPVPKGFTGPDQRLTWTLVVNGVTLSIPLRMHIDYNISPFKQAAPENTPPVVKLFAENSPQIAGPVANGLKPTATKTTSVSTPLDLPVWATDDALYSSGTNAPMRNPPPPVELNWTKYRGPGTVTFEGNQPKFEVFEGGNVGQLFRGKASTKAKFSEAGEYLILLTANDYSGDGGGGEACCWTTAIVKVTVTP